MDNVLVLHSCAAYVKSKGRAKFFLQALHQFLHLSAKFYNVKSIISIFLFISSLSLFAQQAEVQFNDKTFNIQVGDTAHLGYGTLPEGEFMYVFAGATGAGKEFGGRSAEVKKVKYYKKAQVYRVSLFIPYLGYHYIDVREDGICQAVEKGEVKGFNQMQFASE